MAVSKDEILEAISSMKVVELSELIKDMEKQFGVSAAAVAVAAPVVGGTAVAEEKTEFDVVLTSAGGNKVPVIKVVREVTNKGLKEAKDLVDNAPKVIMEAVKKADAEAIIKKLVEVGAQAEMK